MIATGPRAQERLAVEATFQDGRVAKREFRSAFYGGLFDRIKAEFWRAVAAGRPARVLELGCGPGTNLGDALAALGESARAVFAVDLSWESLKQASGDPRLARGPIRYVRADAEHLGVRSESLDLVYGLGILHHLSRPAIYEEIHRVLRPGGRAVFLEPLAGNWFVDAFRRLTPKMRSPFETPLVWEEWQRTGTPLRVVHREFLLVSLAAVAFGAVARRGALKQAVDGASWTLDARLTTRWPSLGRWCWLSILEFTRPER